MDSLRRETDRMHPGQGSERLQPTDEELLQGSPVSSPGSAGRSSPCESIEVDSPGPSRSESPQRRDGSELGEYREAGREAYSAVYHGHRSPSPAHNHHHHHSPNHTHNHRDRTEPRAYSPPPRHQHHDYRDIKDPRSQSQDLSSSSKTSSSSHGAGSSHTNSAPKLSFGISRILSDDAPSKSSTKGPTSDSPPLHSPPPSSSSVYGGYHLKPTDLRLHSVVVPHPLRRGLSVVVPHPGPLYSTGPLSEGRVSAAGGAEPPGHLSPAGGDGPPSAPIPPPAHHHPHSTASMLPPHPSLPSPHHPSASLAAVHDLQGFTSMAMAGGGVIRVPAHRPLALPPGVTAAMSPLMFPWMQDRKERLTGQYSTNFLSIS